MNRSLVSGSGCAASGRMVALYRVNEMENDGVQAWFAADVGTGAKEKAAPRT
jgi:hypothetical protein